MKDLIGLKRQQILKACQALLKYVEKQKTGTKDLLEEDEIIYLVRENPFFASCISQHQQGAG